MSRRRLIVFARAPVAGEAKTRLCPPLGPDEAARLAEAFLLDTVETFEEEPGLHVSVAFTPPERAGLFRRLLGDSRIPRLAPQSHGDLGDRLLGVFTAACPTWWPVAVIGTDSPDLPPEYVREAFEVLERDAADVVLGPARDGGYYLAAARQPHPALFVGIPWSTPGVLSTTLVMAEGAGLRAHLLPAWEDVDTSDDLRRLSARLRDAPPLTAPRSRAVLRGLGWG